MAIVSQMAHSIVLVDDHDLVRGGLQPLIEEEGIFSVSAQFGNGAELLQALPMLNPQPEVIILDLNMPVMGGRETLLHLQELPTLYKVLVLTISGEDQTVLDMVRLGARGFLPKYCTRLELRKALQDIVNTGYYHSELEVNVLYQSFTKQDHQGRSLAPPPPDRLTSREIEFIKLVCDKRELPYKLIAQEMNVVFRTVDGYRESVFMKLNVKTKLGLVFYALRSGIVRFEDITT